jgi:hypothetical protein
MNNIETLIDRLTDRQRHAFAVTCARRVQHLMHDPRSVAALDTRERWLRGEATDAEMEAALDVARAASAALEAAWAAARDAASAAARDAAWAAVEAAAWAAVWAAPYAASAAARAAALAAERAWQIEELERMLAEGGGA